jgi:hypothetical protein
MFVPDWPKALEATSAAEAVAGNRIGVNIPVGKKGSAESCSTMRSIGSLWPQQTKTGAIKMMNGQAFMRAASLPNVENHLQELAQSFFGR